ncbi:MAG: patatin-like phospholipase family protein [Candidatus Binatia bacterium]
MSGGGARGAYEAGVIGWVLDELPRRLGRSLRFDVVTGTSVGAIHACWVAATQGEADAGERLAAVWRSLEISGVYDVGLSDIVALPLRLLGLATGRVVAGKAQPDRLGGLLDARPLETIVRDRIPWGPLRRNLDTGGVALAIAATEVATGRSVVWIDGEPVGFRPWRRDPFVVARPTPLAPIHALASAAIPFLFPALRVDGAYYCDGGLRLNTPLSPALRLGADRLLIVGLRHVPSPTEEAGLRPQHEHDFPSLAYLAGKVLNALLLDHVDYDVARLRVVNTILETGLRTYGPDFVDRINTAVGTVSEDTNRIVRHVYMQPSADLGALAAECIDHERPGGGLRGWLADTVVRGAVRGLGSEADLLSYLLFDRCYAAHLMELGRRDAEARADEIGALFTD